MGDERRKDPRFPMRVEAEVKFTSWHVYSLIYTINISKGGLNLEMPEEPQIGSKLAVKIRPPDGDLIILDAVVRHATKSGSRYSVGVQFESLDAKKRESIERAIRSHGVMLTQSGLTPRNK